MEKSFVSLNAMKMVRLLSLQQAQSKKRDRVQASHRYSCSSHKIIDFIALY